MSSFDATLGAILIGVITASCLLGITFVQTCYYCKHQNDRIWLKALVATVVVFDICHQALISHAVYTYVITNFANPAILATTIWSILLEVLFNGATALLVQGFLTMRVWKMSEKQIGITVFCASLVFAEFGCISYFGVYALFRVRTFEELATLKTLSVAINVLAAAGDMSLACALVYLLSRQKTGCTRSRLMIRTLILYTINTGIVTSICALASLVSILIWGDTFIYIAFFFCIGRLYANMLLATLNARRRMRKSGFVSNTISEVVFHNTLGELPGTIRSGAFKVGRTNEESVENAPLTFLEMISGSGPTPESSNMV